MKEIKITQWNKQIKEAMSRCFCCLRVSFFGEPLVGFEDALLIVDNNIERLQLAMKHCK